MLGGASAVDSHGAVELLTKDVGVAGVPMSLGEYVTRMLNSFTSGRGHHGTWPGASMARASIVASAWSHTRRYRSTISARVSCSVAHMPAPRAESSSHRGTGSGNGRSKTSPKYLASEIDRCLIRPRRLVPVKVSGRRMSYSESPSSFESSASRIQRRSSCRYVFA
jgi:hypothetical protein